MHFSTFRYYSGEKVAPIPTIFIGGNHEGSNYLQELGYGGWVAPNIYYMGYAGVINVNGIRIGGISGIFKGYDYRKGHFEFPPYNENTKKSVYHIRSLEVFRLKQITPKIDIMISHDWPTNVTNHGNVEQLLRFKPYFRQDIENNRLGSPPCEELLDILKPKHWFSAHLHCRFTASIKHSEDQKTEFLALDKCLPKRRFLEIITIGENVEKKLEFSYDLEWLTILSLTNNLLNVKSYYTKLPQDFEGERWNFTPTPEEMDAVLKKFNGNLKIPDNFVRTAASYNPMVDSLRGWKNLDIQGEINPQTTEFCEKLGIDDPMYLALSFAGKDMSQSSFNVSQGDPPLDSSLNDSFNLSTSEADVSFGKRAPLASFLPKPKWTEEIDLDSGSSDENTLETSKSSKNSSLDDSLKRNFSEICSDVKIPERIEEVSEETLKSSENTLETSENPLKSTENSCKSLENPSESLGNLEDHSKSSEVPQDLLKSPVNPLNSPKTPEVSPKSFETPSKPQEPAKLPGETPSKKFKRRNQSIYATDD